MSHTEVCASQTENEDEFGPGVRVRVGGDGENSDASDENGGGR